MTDANGVTPDFSGVAQFDPGLDVNAAYVTNVTTSTGEADTGQLVKLTVTMSEAVTVTTTGGSPTLSLSDGATATYDGASSIRPPEPWCSITRWAPRTWTRAFRSRK